MMIGMQGDGPVPTRSCLWRDITDRLGQLVSDLEHVNDVAVALGALEEVETTLRRIQALCTAFRASAQGRFPHP